MSQWFPSSWLDELYSRVDIVQLVSSYLPLNKKGGRFWGLCPFHNEKTPSFSVNPEQNLYYCFGCHAGGSIINFVMEMEKLNFKEAVVFLAKQFNVPLPVSNFKREEIGLEHKKERLYLANEEAAKYYHSLLWKKEGETVLKYFKKRGISDNTIRCFGLGASVDSWTALTDYLLGKDFTIEELKDAGLTLVKEKGYFDMFRNRAIFPIISSQGKVCGFGGRAFDDGMPKYLNTPDTVIYNKRLRVYGENILRNQRKLKRIILTEGYMDTITLIQAGVEGVTASLGTAFTAEQARFLRRYAPEVWICYDGDEAGQNATEKAISILKTEGIPTRVIVLPEGQDPDDVIKNNGIHGFNELKAISAKEFLIEKLARKFDLSNSVENQAYVKSACRIVTGSEPVETDYLARIISLKSGFEKGVVLAQVEIAKRNENNELSNQIKVVREIKPRAEDEVDMYKNAEFILLAMMATSVLPKDLLSEETFSNERNRQIASLLISGVSIASVIDQIDDSNERALYSKVLSDEMLPDKRNAAEAAKECISLLRRKQIENRKSEISIKLNTAGEDEKARLLTEIIKLNDELDGIAGD